MPKAFLLINVRPGTEDDVLKHLKGIEEVKEVKRVYGVYDMVVKLEAGSMEKLKEVMNKQIKKLGNITSLTTLVVVSEG